MVETHILVIILIIIIAILLFYIYTLSKIYNSDISSKKSITVENEEENEEKNEEEKQSTKIPSTSDNINTEEKVIESLNEIFVDDN